MQDNTMPWNKLGNMGLGTCKFLYRRKMKLVLDVKYSILQSYDFERIFLFL